MLLRLDPLYRSEWQLTSSVAVGWFPMGRGSINGVITSSWPDTTCLHIRNLVIRIDARRKILRLETILSSLSYRYRCISFYHWEPVQYLSCCIFTCIGGRYLFRFCKSAVGRWKATCSLLSEQSCLWFSGGLMTLMKEKLVRDDAVFLHKECRERALTFTQQWWCLLVNM